MHTRYSIALLVVVTLACLGMPQAWAQNQSGKAISIDIPSQPLGEALTALAKQTGLQVVLYASAAKQATTERLAGMFTPEAALQRLLTNTGLRYEYLDEQTVAVLREGDTVSAQGAGVSAVDDGKDRLETRVAQADSPAGQRMTEDQNAADSTENNLKLDEIVVTAQKRKERLLETPISIGVLSGKDLDRSSSRGLTDVLGRVGGVSVIEASPGNSQIAIRGVVPGIGASTAGYYLDEVPYAAINTARLPDANAYDLARVEVLRGPQGTLYGVNALSGVVRVLTNDADLNAFEMKGRARVSNTDEGGSNYGGDLAVNVPLIPGELAIRASASYADLSGFIDSVPPGGAVTRRVNDTVAEAYRLKVGYQPTENLNIKLGISRSEIENGAPSRAFDDLTTSLSGFQSNRDVYDMYNLIGEYAWPTVSLLSSTSYLDNRGRGRVEILLAGTTLNFLGGNLLESFAQEFRLSSHLTGPWQWSAGAIYKDTQQGLSQDASPGVGIGVFSAFLPFVYQVDDQSESYAAFGEMTRALADGRFELTAGLRYFEDSVITRQLSDFASPTNVVPIVDRDFDQLTGRLVLAWKPQMNRTFYGSIASGFKSGLNQEPAVVRRNPQFAPVDPDSLINYELGAKGTLLDGALTYDTAVYYTDWQDIQQSLIVGTFVARVNAGTASGPGVDAAVTFQPTRAFSLNAAVGWNGLEFDESVLSGTTTLFRAGERINNSPQWNGSIGADYSVPTPMTGVRAIFSTDFSYRSGIVLRALANNVVTASDADTIRRLNAAIGLEGARWSAELFGDNLLNEWEQIAPEDSVSANTSVRMRPRTIGLQATFNF
jgi:iron complex outermembrane recepter protein